MKKLILLFFAALCIIIASCSKDSGFGPGSDPSLAYSKGHPVHSPVVVYKPAVDGDDTDELLAVITAAEPGTVIKLLEGEYHVGYIEILGFNGTIMGSGNGKTIISPSGLFDQNSQIARNLMPGWWRIIGGNVVLSDLTFKTGNGSLVMEPDIWYNNTMVSLIIVNNYNQDYLPDNPPLMNFAIRNVGFICGYLDPVEAYLGSDFNVLMPLWLGMDVWVPLTDIMPSKGSYEIANCYFEHGFEGPEIFSFGPEAVGKIEKCKIDKCGWGIYCTANYGSKIDILNNSITNSTLYGTFLEDNDWGLMGNVAPVKRCEYVVSGNYFSTLPGTTGLIFKDNWGKTHPDIYKPILAMIKNNQFIMSDESTGINLLNNVDGQVRNNRFMGTGSLGVYVDGAMVYDPMGNEAGVGEAKNVLILGNNFTGLNAMTDIVLGDNSSNCTVVGSGKESVINTGTNNKIVGMKMKYGGNHIGPAIRDNFRMWHGMRHH